MLPLERGSLCYGSKDGGENVHCSNPKFNQLMEEVGQKLNLAPHLIGNSGVSITGPGDIEGHIGKVRTVDVGLDIKMSF